MGNGFVLINGPDVERILEPQITHRGLRPQPKKGRSGEDEKILQITKKMAAILGYLKCFLKEDFQDVTKKFLPKKQEIERLYYREKSFLTSVSSVSSVANLFGCGLSAPGSLSEKLWGDFICIAVNFYPYFGSHFLCFIIYHGGNRY